MTILTFEYTNIPHKPSFNSSSGWPQVSWAWCERIVRILQEQIYCASKAKHPRLVKSLQIILASLFESRLLAVRCVSTVNRRLRLFNIKNTRSLSPEEKFTLARLLVLGSNISTRCFQIGYGSQASLKEVVGLDTFLIYDSAKQMLFRFAVEPQWEAFFDDDSYGSRPGRNIYDAIEAIAETLRTRPNGNSGITKWVLRTSLDQNFSKLNVDFLVSKLQTTDDFQLELRAWLNKDYLNSIQPKGVNLFLPALVYQRSFSGNVLAHFLINVILNGVEQLLKDFIGSFPTKSSLSKNLKSSLRVIRFVDNFVIISNNRSTLCSVRNRLDNWLVNTSGLNLAKTYTSISSATQKFDFLGFSFICSLKTYRPSLKIYPSLSSQRNLIFSTREIIQRNKAASVTLLIKKLRPILTDWGNFFQYTKDGKVFSRLDYIIWQQLRAWINRRSHGRSKTVIWRKCFPGTKTLYNGKIYNDKWILKSFIKYEGCKLKEIFLPNLSWTPSRKWIKVKSKSSPFDSNSGYWAERRYF